MMPSVSEMATLGRRLGQGMRDEVTLLIFTDDGTLLAQEIVAFARALAEMSPKIRVEIEKVVDGKNQRMSDLRIENHPVMVLVKGDFNRIRYYGLPGGYEASALADGIVELSNSRVALSPQAKASLDTVRRRANIKVFVMTTCPFCPIVVRHAYRAALGSSKVTSEVIDVQMFPDLALKHSVMGVPKVILNDNTDLTGAMEEAVFFAKLKEADIALLDSIYG
ncbi:MAG: thioredoxin family protein [Thermoplasmata archaeon]